LACGLSAYSYRLEGQDSPWQRMGRATVLYLMGKYHVAKRELERARRGGDEDFGKVIVGVKEMMEKHKEDPWKILGYEEEEEEKSIILTPVEQLLFECRPGTPWKVKERCIEALAERDEGIIPLLIECLRGDLSGDLTDSLRKKIEFENEKRETWLCRADGSTLGIPYCAEEVLKKMGKPAVPYIIESITSQPATISVAARILGRIGEKEVIPVLIPILQNCSIDKFSKITATTALRELEAKEAIPILIDELEKTIDETSDNMDRYTTYIADALVGLTGESFGFTLVCQSSIEDKQSHIPKHLVWRRKSGEIENHYVFIGSILEKQDAIKSWRQWSRNNIAGKE